MSFVVGNKDQRYCSLL